MICTHVGDLLTTRAGEGPEAVQTVLDNSSAEKIEEGSFQYGGRRFTQDPLYNVHIDVQDNRKGLKPVTISPGRFFGMGE